MTKISFTMSKEKRDKFKKACEKRNSDISKELRKFIDKIILEDEKNN